MITNASLSIVAGIPPALGDENNAEDGAYGSGVFSLELTGATKLLAISANDWIPNIVQPQIIMSNGRPIRTEYPNVTEIINLVIAAGQNELTHAVLSRLARFSLLISEYQVIKKPSPVYLKWAAVGAPGPQYAEIITLNYAIKGSGVTGQAQTEITISVDREPGWRPIPPCANPILWTFMAAGTLDSKTYSDMDLLSNHSNSVATKTVDNAKEGTSSGLAAFQSENWIDIDGTDIPGDLPALLCLTLDEGSHDSFSQDLSQQRYVGLRSGPVSTNNRLGTTVAQQYSFCAGDGNNSQSTDTIGLRSYASPTTRQSRLVTLTSIPTQGQVILYWYNISTYLRMTAAMLQGTFAVFLRALEISAMDANVTAYLKYGMAGDEGNRVTTTPVIVNKGVIGGSYWGVTALGTITLPITSAKATVHHDGRGLSSNSSNNYDVAIELWFEDYTGSTGTMRVLDIVMLPVDEGMVKIGKRHESATYVSTQLVGGDGLPALGDVVYDNTGYLSRGEPEHLAMGHRLSNSDDLQNVPVYGQELYLQPGKNNRLYFFYSGIADTVTGDQVEQSDPQLTADVSVRIVPRWSGRRDV